MKQYLELGREILNKGTYKSPARLNMPGTTSLFGAQFRHNLADGFPILTTKKLSFKNIVTELLWFMKGDTNIKFLVDNGCNIWNEDAYNYYKKITSKNTDSSWNNIYANRGNDNLSMFTYEEFVNVIKNYSYQILGKDFSAHGYILGDCGKQYGWLWRNWETQKQESYHENETYSSGEWKWKYRYKVVDQLQELIDGLQKNPMSRRHIITAWNPTTLDDMALNACHAFVQFNCRPIGSYNREDIYAEKNNYTEEQRYEMNPNASDEDVHNILDEENIPKYYLDCQLYQRSADYMLGVPYNIASYALLTEIISKLVNMIPGEFIHTFGDVHIYDSHLPIVKEQLKRIPSDLSKLNLTFQYPSLDNFLENVFIKEIVDSLKNYSPQSSIKAELFTGLQK